MTLAGHSRAHFPQPTHAAALTWAATPRMTAMAPRGHTFTQQPQATQADVSTTALRRFFTEFIERLPRFDGIIIHRIRVPFCDEITEGALSAAGAGKRSKHPTGLCRRPGRHASRASGICLGNGLIWGRK